MAAIGKTGSFATVTPVQDTVGDALKYTNELFDRSEQRRKAEAEAKAKKEDNNLKELEEYNSKFGVNLTGNQSVNDLTIPYATQARDKVANITREIQNTSDNNKKAKLMSERSRIVQSFDILKQVPTLLNTKGEEIAKGVKEGKYNDRDVDAVLETLKQIETGKAHLYVDDYGQPRATIFKTDENGKPTGIIEKDQTISEIISGVDPYLKSTYALKDGIIDQFLNTVKQDESKIQNGFTTITKEQMSQRVKDMAQKKGIEVANNDNEVYEIWNSMGKPPKRKFTEEDKKEVAEYVKDDLLGRYKTVYKKEIDQSGILAKQRFEEDKKEKAVEKIKSTFDKQLTHDDFTGRTLQADVVNPNMVSVPDKKITFSNLGGAKSGLNNGYVTGFALQKDGTVIVTGKALKDKGQKFKAGGKDMGIAEALSSMSNENTPQSVKNELQPQLDSYSTSANYGNFVRVVSGPELSGLAKMAGYNSDKELESELKQMNPSNKTESEQLGL